MPSEKQITNIIIQEYIREFGTSDIIEKLIVPGGTGNRTLS